MAENRKTTKRANQTAQTKPSETPLTPPKKKKSNIHDIFFKAVFGLSSIVKAFLEQFTPSDFFVKLDLESLEISNTSYITEELSPHFADMVWTCRFKNSRQNRQIAFLFEHKSFKSAYPHFQLSDYLNGAYKKQAENNQKPLIPILPIIVYHGRKKWNYQSYASYFGTKKQPVDADLLRFLPSFDYLFVNLAELPDEIIKTYKFILLQKTMLAFKHCKDKKYLRNNIKELWFGHYGSKKTEETYSFIRYLGIYLSNNLGITRQELFEEVKNSDNTLNSEAMTIIDEFIQEGVKIGTERGREIGREIGIEIGTELGKKQGKEMGIEIGTRQGKEIGIEIGTKQGKEIGIEIGTKQGKEIGIEIGTKQGKEMGIEIGTELGKEIGKEIGKEEATHQKNREFTINLLNTGDFDDEKVAYLVGVDIDFVLMVKAELADKNDLDNTELAQSN